MLAREGTATIQVRIISQPAPETLLIVIPKRKVKTYLHNDNMRYKALLALCKFFHHCSTRSTQLLIVSGGFGGLTGVDCGAAGASGGTDGILLSGRASSRSKIRLGLF